MISNFVSNLNMERKKDAEQFNEVLWAKYFFIQTSKLDDFHLRIDTGSWE